MKKKTRLIALALLLALTCAMLPQMALTARAEEAYSGTCGIQGVDGDNLTWTLDPDLGILTIEGSGEMANYDYGDDAPWFDERELIKTVILPDGLTSVGAYAFYDCISLTDVTIPDTVIRIGNAAFCNCELLDTTIPDSVTSIGNSAFSCCLSLSSVSIPEGLTEIGKGAFSVCEGLTEINVASGNPSYSSLDGVLFNKDRTELIQYPCGKKGSVYAIPDGVKTVAEEAFWSYDLVTITIPGSVENLDCTFNACYSLESIQVSSDNQYYSSIDGVLFNKYEAVLLQYPKARTAVSYTIPDGVLRIEQKAFYNAFCLEKLTISNSVTTIEDGAFQHCYELASVKLPESVQRIGKNAFEDTAYFEKEENWNGRLLYLGNWLLAARSEILTADIREGTVGIAGSAFSNCVSMTAVSIPDSVKTIGARAFDSCSSLATVNMGNGVTEIGNEAFYECDSLKSITLPDSLTSIGDSSFFDCTALESITIPESVTEIGTYAFDWCDALEEVTISEGVTHIGEGAFYGCPKLTSVEIPASVTEIGDLAFGYGWNDGYELYGITIYGDKDTAAQRYAKENRFNFVLRSKSNPFADVQKSDFFFNPVMWALGNDVTGGTDETHFSPNQTVQRCDSMVFFWAAKDRPEHFTEESPFKDVKKKHWYYDAVMWAVENEITGGTDATHFSPKQTCSRSEILQFLYAAEGKPSYSIDNPYSDVKAKQWYYDGAIWAYENGMEKGENGKFNAKTPCTRGYVVTYLFRYLTGLERVE